jgi:hypothetical protein
VSVVYIMKQKRKAKNGYRLSNKRFLVVAIGLLVILILAVSNMAYMANHRMTVGQTATAILNINLVDSFAGGFEQTATQVKIEMEATQTAEADEP